MSLPKRPSRAVALERRRMTLEIRTLTVSLRGALADLEQDDTLTVAEQVAIRRAWCERVAVLIQDIRVRSMRIERLTMLTRDSVRPPGLPEVADIDIIRLPVPAVGHHRDRRVS